MNINPESENVINLYQRHAVAWDGDRGRDLYEKALLDRFLTLMPSHASILDIGCGSAEPIGGYLIGSGCDVTGVDSSPSMIDMGKGRFPDQNWVVHDMRTLALSRTFDGVLAWDSFFHLSPVDQRGMFPVFRRHARPGAALMFTSGPSHGEVIGTYRGEPLYHGSLDQDEYRLQLDRNGFDVVAHVVEDPDCGLRTVWLARAR